MPTNSSRPSDSPRHLGGLQALSVGPAIDPWTARTGVVHSVFARTVNLLVDGEMWSVLGAEQADAPFGIRLAPSGGCAGLGVKPSDGVHVRAGYIGLGRLTIDCRAASRWTPAPWPEPAAGLSSRISSRLYRVEQAARPRAWAGSEDVATQVTAALRGNDVDLARAVRRSVGLGPGTTPAGDDVLVGMLTVLSSSAAGEKGAGLTARLVRALAPALPSTPDVSRHLLTQAARGLPARALHELGAAVVQGANGPVLENALQVVLSTGCTSGADACLGLIAACRISFLHAERDAA
jgi:hypothetical protein